MKSMDSLPGLDEQLLDLDEDRALIRWLRDRQQLSEDEARAELARITDDLDGAS